MSGGLPTHSQEKGVRMPRQLSTTRLRYGVGSVFSKRVHQIRTEALYLGIRSQVSQVSWAALRRNTDVPTDTYKKRSIAFFEKGNDIFWASKSRSKTRTRVCPFLGAVAKTCR